MHIFGIIFFLALSALSTGLTIAYMSLDLATLERLTKQGNKHAKMVLEIRRKSMQLLTALLLITTFANAFATTIISNQISGLLAGTISAVLIFLLADVLPQAYGTRFALSFGAWASPIIKIILFILRPITIPIAYILEKMLGEEESKRLSKHDLLSILDDSEKHHVKDVDFDERRIARGAFSFSNRRVSDVLTPNSVVKSISIDNIIDERLLLDLKEHGYSRIPVEDPDTEAFVGILYLKDLIGITPPIPVKDICDKGIYSVHSNDPLDIVLAKFIETKNHLFVVHDQFGGFAGVITVEDILEEIIGQEIMDEDDEIPDLRQFAKSRQKFSKRK